MILDKQLKVSDQQAVTATAASTDYIDQGAAGDAYDSLFLVVTCDVTAESGGATTLDLALETDDNSSFSSATKLAEKTGIAKATCVAGAELWKIPVPPGAERYMRVKYTVNTANFSAGKFSAFLVKDVKIGNQ